MCMSINIQKVFLLNLCQVVCCFAVQSTYVVNLHPKPVLYLFCLLGGICVFSVAAGGTKE